MSTPAQADELGTRIRVSGASRPGHVRSVNQDAHFAGEVGARTLLLVADGMGGHQTGEVASAQATEAIRAQLASSRAHPPAALARALQRANHEVLAHARADPKHEGMGTTLTAVLIDDDIGLIAHVGDSRAYLWRDGALHPLTEDHSWVAERVRQGLLSEEEARQHRWRNVITNALGATDRFRLDLAHVALQAGDRLLVASDGVTALIPEGELAEMLAEGAPDEVVARLLDAADARGSPDNVTAAVAVVDAAQHGPRPYELPAAVPWTVDVGDTLSGIRQVEDRYPGRGPLRWARRQSWYPYRLWILGSLYLFLLLLAFLLVR
ncbi:MAG: protein phosphatase 2C domain-containing protein [Trueperaceae bacterium]|nr:protein phosphatase 2C domain-containing protein [Trueperaceae bacterium]